MSDETKLEYQRVPTFRDRDRALSAKARRQLVLVQGGPRVMKVKVSVPIEEWRGLQRFEGETDGDKINTLIRIANARIAQLEKQRDRDAAGVRPPAPVNPSAR